jgi:hypothetical protein
MLLFERLKPGDKIIHLETSRSSDVISVSLGEVERKVSNSSFIYKDVISPFYLIKERWNYKLKVFFRYFRHAEFICSVSTLLNSASLFRIASDDDISFIEALSNIPSRSRIWSEIYNLYPEEMIQRLKPYILSYKLGRKENGR